MNTNFLVLETNKARFVRVDGLVMISFLLTDCLRLFKTWLAKPRYLGDCCH